MNEFESKLKSALILSNIQAEPASVSRLYEFYQRIIEKNKVMNLTAITQPDDFIQKHFIDSLSLIPQTKTGKQIAEGKRLRLIDVGTGCGLPGLALKIVYPQLEVILFDSLKKRLTFLDETIEAMGLEGVETLHGRAEDLGHDPRYRESFDLAIARAVANLSTLSEYCLPFVKCGGSFAAYKSAELQDELKASGRALEILGGKIKEINEFRIPGTELGRAIAVIEKVKPTPPTYPRRAGTPVKEPL